MHNIVPIIALSLWTSAVAQAQFKTEWTQTYNSPQNASPKGLVVDAQGNLCVLADSFGEFAVVKYSATGTPLWTNRYDSSHQDVAGRIATDSNGFIWATGLTTTDAQLGSLVVIRYAPNGTVAWTRTGDVTNIAVNTSPLIATDAAGDAVVTVISLDQIMTVKYSASGTPRWTNSQPIEVNWFGSLRTLHTDAVGNAALVAEERTTGAVRMVFLKYSPAGTPWLNVAHDFPNSAGFLADSTVDPAGYIYVAGNVWPDGSRYQFFTAKYDPAGALLWSRSRPPANGYHAITRRIALDSSGNVIVTGYETQPVSEDEDQSMTVTVKYGPTGAELWSARSGLSERRPSSLVIDDTDNIYVAGSDYTEAGSIAFLLKYRPNGNQAAQAILPSTFFGSIAVGMPGEIYLSQSPGLITRKLVHTDEPSPLNATIAPALTEVFPGTSVTFTALVSGLGPFTYDWRYFGYRTGGTNATFTITNAQFQWKSQGDYSVIVSNATGYTISPEARLSILRVPTVQVQATDYFVTNGQSVTFSATASGTLPLSFSWLFNGRPIPGATSNAFTLASVRASDAGHYAVVVSNRAGTTTSSVVRLTLTLPPIAFINSTAMQITSNPIAAPYPSEITVSGVTGRVVKVTAALRQVIYDFPGSLADLAVLLEEPSGLGLLLMADAGEDTAADGETLIFDDDANTSLEDESFPIEPVRPSAYSSPTFPPPASSGPRVETLTALIPQNPNGVWRLFVINQYPSPFVPPGQIAGGWELKLFVQDPTAVTSPAFTRITRMGGQIRITWDGAPGWRLQRSPSLALPEWADVPDTEGANEILLPMGAGPEFFRVFHP